MPLFTLEELGEAAPLFKGQAGGALGNALMKMLAVSKINDLYDRYSDLSGPDFTGAVLDDVGVGYEVFNAEILERLPDGPFITISNHPYGGIDGVVLVDLFGRIRPDYKVMANRFLGRIETLKDNFICVTPTGTDRTAPTKDSVQGIKEAMLHVRSGHPLGIFPAGAISDLSLKDCSIRDREWQEPVIRLIKKLNVPILPVHFLDKNSDFYYMLGLINWRVRLLKLPSEVFNKKGKRTRIAIGPVITTEQQAEFTDLHLFGDFLRSKVYNQY